MATGIPHLAVPFTIGATGAAQTVQQGTVAEVVQSVANLMGTRPGTRMLLPTYGLPDPTFTGVSVRDVEVATARWERRARVSVGVTPGNTEQVTVQVGLVSGGAAA